MITGCWLIEQGWFCSPFTVLDFKLLPTNILLLFFVPQLVRKRFFNHVSGMIWLMDTAPTPMLYDPVTDNYSQAQIDRNFRLGVINGVLYLFANSLFDPTLVLVAFLSNLTDSALLLGLVVPMTQAGWSLPQLWLSGYVQNQPLKIKIYRHATWVRILAWGVLATAMNLVKNAEVMVVVFFVTFAVSSLASGLGGLPFMEVVSKTIPPRRRGEMFAWRFGIGGLVSVAGSFLVRWLLSAQSALTFPKNYGVLGILFFIFASIGLVFFNHVEEKPDVQVQPRRNLRTQIMMGLKIFNEDSNYRKFVFFQIMMIFSGVAVPFFAVFVQQELGGNISWVGIYLILTMSSNLLVNYLYGRLSRRISNQFVLRIGTLSGVLMSVWVLGIAFLVHPYSFSPDTVSMLFIPAFVLNSFRQNGIGVSGNGLLLSLTPPKTRTVMLGFTQTLLGFILILTGFVGVIVDVWGFSWLVCLTFMANITALPLVFTIKEGKE